RIARRNSDRSTPSGIAALPLDTRNGGSMIPLRSASGSAVVTLASTLSAALCKTGSRKRRTSRAPTAIASTSSAVNISGGKSKPRRSKIPQPRSTLDGDAPRLQGRDIPVHRSDRDLETLSDHCCRHWLNGNAQHLNDVEQPIRAPHRSSIFQSQARGY